MFDDRAIKNRIVLHVDMDAFFAAVEERDKPELRGRPIVVGADPKEGQGRGVVSTANYEARKYGVHSAMPISTAWRLCKKGEQAPYRAEGSGTGQAAGPSPRRSPDQRRGEGGQPCVFVQPDFERYAATSDRIMRILRNYAIVSRTHDRETLAQGDGGIGFEQVSVDEAYLIPAISYKPYAIRHTHNKLGIRHMAYGIRPWTAAQIIATKIKNEIWRKERLTCSVGIGPNKLVAKIASDFQKPDGLTVVPRQAVQKFLDPLDVRVIPGIGPKSAAVLTRRFGAHTVRDLRQVKLGSLVKTFGASGEDMYNKARGIDASPVRENTEIKSLGRQETLERDTLDVSILINLVKQLARLVAADILSEEVDFRTIELTVRFEDFETHSRQETLSRQANDARTLEKTGLKLLLPFLDKRENSTRKRVRLLGLRVSHLRKR